MSQGNVLNISENVQQISSIGISSRLDGGGGGDPHNKPCI